jgi:cysteine desulfurase
MQPFWSDEYGNAASVNHAFGWAAAEAVDRARRQVAALVGGIRDCVVFTSGATEANNLALKGVFGSGRSGGHLVVTAAEHRAVLDPAKRLRRQGVDVTILPVDEHAAVDPQQVRDALRPETRLVSVIWANNEVGTLNGVAEIAGLCRERGVLFHTDAVQAVGKVPVDLDEVPVDMLSASAHKLYGPKGVGMLFVRRGERRVRLQPLLDGGGHERGLRSGTLPVPLVVGFGAACELAQAELPTEAPRLLALREQLWQGLADGLGDVILNGDPTRRLPANLNVSVPGVDGEALMTALVLVAVSSGSACTSSDPEPSHVLRAMGRDDVLTRASLRFGLGRFNTAEDVEFAAGYVAEVVRRLRS